MKMYVNESRQDIFARDVHNLIKVGFVADKLNPGFPQGGVPALAKDNIAAHQPLRRYQKAIFEQNCFHICFPAPIFQRRGTGLAGGRQPSATDAIGAGVFAITPVVCKDFAR